MSRWLFGALLFMTACGDTPDTSDKGTDSSDGVSNETPGKACGDQAERSGEATYYAADGSGNCSFDPTPGDLNVAALNTTDYAGSAMCGACLAITGPNGSITVRVVDRCPGCAPGDVDLSERAFAAIAPLERGRVPITWRVVPCAVDGPMRYRFKEGSSEYWVGIQVRNHRMPIAKLEAEVNGSFREIPRESYNYFVQAGGLGPGPYRLRLTDIEGEVVEEPAIALGDTVERVGTAQFSGCP